MLWPVPLPGSIGNSLTSRFQMVEKGKGRNRFANYNNPLKFRYKGDEVCDS